MHGNSTTPRGVDTVVLFTIFHPSLVFLLAFYHLLDFLSTLFVQSRANAQKLKTSNASICSGKRGFAVLAQGKSAVTFYKTMLLSKHGGSKPPPYVCRRFFRFAHCIFMSNPFPLFSLTIQAQRKKLQKKKAPLWAARPRPATCPKRSIKTFIKN